MPELRALSYPDNPNLTEARSVLAAAATEKRGLSPVETATVLRAVPDSHRAVAAGLLNVSGRNADRRDVDRRDALAKLLDDSLDARGLPFDPSEAEMRADRDRRHDEARRQGEQEVEAARRLGLLDADGNRPGGPHLTHLDGAGGWGASRGWLPSLAEYRQMQVDNRAVGTTGAMIPVGYHGSYFDQLRKRTAVLAAGPVLIPMEEQGSLKVPAVTGSVTVGGIAEAGEISASDPTLSTITLDPKKFAAMTLVNREAVEDSNPNLREVVSNSLIRDMAVALDAQLVTGSGSGQNLTGLRNIASTTAGPSTGTDGAALSFDHLADTLGAYDGANLDPDRAAWIMHSRTWSSVRKLVDDQSRPLVSVDPTSDVRVTLWGKPVYISNSLSVAETVGSSSDCSTILLCDMSQIVVGVSRAIEVVMSEHYAFANDQIAIRVTARYDIGAPQPTAIVKTVGIRA